jgi:hypothetical protein
MTATNTDPVIVNDSVNASPALDCGEGAQTYKIVSTLTKNVTIEDNEGLNQIVFADDVVATVENIELFGAILGVNITLNSGAVVSIVGLDSYTYTVKGTVYETPAAFVSAFKENGISPSEVNAPPVFNEPPSDLRIDEIARGSDPVTGKIVGQVTATDPDGVTYSIHSATYQDGTPVSGFAIDGDGNITYSGGDDLDADRAPVTQVILRVSATDNVNPEVLSDPITVTINDINDELPVFRSGGEVSLDENETFTGGVGGTVIYTADARPDLVDIEWKLADAENSPFMIDANSGAVRFKQTITHDADAGNTSYTFTVIAKSGNVEAPQTVTVTINDLVDEEPDITSSSTGNARDENTEITGGPSGTIVYTADGTPDVSTDKIVWSIRDGDAGLFDINTDGEVRFKTNENPDHETKDAYTFTLVATTGTFESSKTVTIPVTDLLDEGPDITSAAKGTARPENTEITGGANGTVVYTAEATPDIAGETITWTLATGNDAGLFNIDQNGHVRFNTDRTPDHESKTAYDFTIVATTGTYQSTQSVKIDVTDLNDNKPRFSNTSNEVTVEEGSTEGIFTASAIADVRGENPTFTIVSGDLTPGGQFVEGNTDYVRIDPTSGVVYLTSAANYDAKPVFSFQITATVGQLTSTYDVTVNLTDTERDIHAPEITKATLPISSGETSTFMLSEDNLAFTDSDTTVETATFTYTIETMSAGISVTRDGTELSANSTFTHQDVLDGLVNLTVTDANDLSGFTLTLSDGTNTSTAQSFTFEMREAVDVVADDNTSTSLDEVNTVDYSAVSNKNLLIDTGDGNDIITGSGGSDEIIGGRGNDIITLDNDTSDEITGGNDIVVYDVGAGFSAADGNDVISGFKVDQDCLLLHALSDDVKIQNLEGYLSEADVDNAAGNDALVLKAIIDFARGVVTGITLNFNGSDSYGDSSGTLTINFDQSMSQTEFGNRVRITNEDGSTDVNFNPLTRLISDPSVLDELLGKGSLTYEVSNLATGINVTQTLTTIAENTDTTGGIKVGEIEITDADGGRHGTLGLTGTNADMFEIKDTTTGSELWLRDGVTVDYETFQSLDVRVQLNEKTTVGDDVAIPVTNVDEIGTAMAFAQTTTTIPENTDITGGKEIGDINITDLDGGSYGTLGLTGDQANLFELRGTKLYLKESTPLDYEDDISNTLSVTVRLEEDHSVSQDVTVTVTDVDETATAIGVSQTTTSIAENTDITGGKEIGDINITDPDGGSYGTFELAGEHANLFELRGTKLYIKETTTLDYEDDISNTMNVTVRLDEDHSISQNVTVSVSDVDETATTMDFAQTTTSIVENTDITGGKEIGDITFTDPDGGSYGTLELTGDHANLFELRGTKLYLKETTTLDYEDDISNTMNVTVRLEEDHSVSQDVSVSVTNAPPEITSGSTGTALPEAAKVLITDVVYTATSDPNEETVDWDLEGTDAEDFEIDEFGNVTFKTNTRPDFENKEVYSFTLVATSSTSVSVKKRVTIDVTDLTTDINFEADDVDIGTVANPGIVQISAPIGHVVGTFKATRPNGNPVTYELSGRDAGYYTIAASSSDPTLYEIKLKKVYDPNLSKTHNITITAYATGQDSAKVDATITINEIVVAPRQYTIKLGESETVGAPTTDKDGDTLSFVFEEGSTGSIGNGTYTITNGDMIWTPNTGVRGPQVFGVDIKDSRGGVVTIIITINVDDGITRWYFNDTIAKAYGIYTSNIGNDVFDGGPGTDQYLSNNTISLNSFIENNNYSVHYNHQDLTRWKQNPDNSWSSGTGSEYTFRRFWYDLNDNGLDDSGDEFDYLKGIETFNIRLGGGDDNRIIGGPGMGVIVYSDLKNNAFIDQKSGNFYFYVDNVFRDSQSAMNFDAVVESKWKQDGNTWNQGTTSEHKFIRFWYDKNGDGREDDDDNYSYVNVNAIGIEGTRYNDQISGLRGEDNLRGYLGDDVIYGREGSDTLYGDLGNDQLYGGPGHDHLYGNPSVLMFGGSNAPQYDQIDNDLLDGGSGVNRLVGGPGNDIFVLYQGPHRPGSKNVNTVNDFSSGTTSGDASYNGTNRGGQDRIRIDTATGLENNLAAIKSSLGIDWRKSSEYDNTAPNPRGTNDVNIDDTIIFTTINGEEVFLMILEDFNIDLTINNFDVV